MGQDMVFKVLISFGSFVFYSIGV